MAQARKTTAEKILDSAAKLSPEEREDLRRLGVNLPIFTDDPTKNAVSTKGYRCKGCGELALEFVGHKFQWKDGTQNDFPDPQIQMSQQPIMQSLRGGAIENRSVIRCQHCGQTIHTTHGYPDPRLILNIDEHARSQEQHRIRRRQALGQREETMLPQDDRVRHADPTQVLKPGLEGVTSEFHDETSVDASELDSEAREAIREEAQGLS